MKFNSKEPVLNFTLELLTKLRLRWLPQLFVHLAYGPRPLLDYVSNKKREWSASPSTASVRVRTSISDSSNYLNACAAALKSEKNFSRFKSEIYYKQILEHTGYKFGREYLRILKRRGFQIPVDFTIRQAGLGSPEVFKFKRLGLVSPSTLRYLKVVSDLDVHFPNWKEQTIVEVGVGYGGQFCAFKELGHTKDYIGIDLEVVAELAKKYTEVSGFQGATNFMNFDGELPSSDGHLFVSNYAFSELAPVHQAFYLEHYIKTSASGYVTWNQLSELNLGGMTAEELKRIVNGRILREEPLTSPGNCLIVW